MEIAIEKIKDLPQNKLIEEGLEIERERESKYVTPGRKLPKKGKKNGGKKWK